MARTDARPRPHGRLRTGLASLVVVAAAVVGSAAAEGDAVVLRVCQPEVFAPESLPEVCGLLPPAPVEGGAEAIEVRDEGGAVVGTLAIGRGPVGTVLFGGVLPELEGRPALRAIDDAAMWPCPPTVDDPGVAFAPVSFAARDGRSVIVLANAPPGAAVTPGVVSAVFVYADGPVRVEASCPASPHALHAAFTLAPGWNVIASAVVEQEGTLAFSLRDLTDADIGTFAWHWQHDVLLPDVAPLTPAPPPAERRP